MPDIQIQFYDQLLTVTFDYTPEEVPMWHRGRLATPYQPAEAEVTTITDQAEYDVTEDLSEHIEQIEQIVTFILQEA